MTKQEAHDLGYAAAKAMQSGFCSAPASITKSIERKYWQIGFVACREDQLLIRIGAASPETQARYAAAGSKQ